MSKVDIIRVEETSVVTDAVLNEIGMESSKPPEPVLEELVRECASDLGITLTDHEVGYIIRTNLEWIWKDINRDLIDRYKARLN